VRTCTQKNSRSRRSPLTSIYAHRGSVGPGTRENTLEAFDQAARLGADGVELDVRRTADGVLVLHHDVEMAGVGPISAVRRRHLPSWVPSLEEALRLCASLGLAVNVEVKSELFGPSHDPEERCASEAATLCEASGGGRIVVSSFARAALAAARAVSAALPLALLVGQLFAAEGWELGDLAGLGLEGVHPADAITSAACVARARAEGLAVRVWTVDDPRRIEELGRLGVEAVITNDVSGARAALGRG
jgi:glycerophosphoryl diester phosphodiesterase